MAERLDSRINLLIESLLTTKDTTGQFTEKLADGRVVDTKSWNVWDWQQGVGLYGVWTYFQKTGSNKAYEIVVKWFEDNLSFQPPKNINTMAPLLTLACLYEKTRNEKYKPVLQDWAEFIMKKLPRTTSGCFQHTTSRHLNEEQIWDDTLFMTVLPLAKIGILFNLPEYVETAKLQFLLHLQYLFDTESGLFFHGWTFDGRNNFGKVKWGRGNAWITVAIPIVLELLNLPETDAFRVFLVEAFRSQTSALAKLQDPESGMFYTVLDAPQDKENYIEASATAGFTCGISKGIKLGIIGPEYEQVMNKSFKAVVDRVLPDGKLKDTSFGTRVGDSKAYYYGIPLTDMPYGQALAIMCLLEGLD
jgi:unsaturated rhamnogalacturonyl hydrolase